MSPVIVVAGGRPVLVLGAPGGPRIPMGVASVISNVLDFRMDPALAVDVARVDAERCCTIELEQGRVRSTSAHELVRRGHHIEDRKEYHPQFGPLVQVAGIGSRRPAFRRRRPPLRPGRRRPARPTPTGAVVAGPVRTGASLNWRGRGCRGPGWPTVRRWR